MRSVPSRRQAVRGDEPKPASFGTALDSPLPGDYGDEGLAAICELDLETLDVERIVELSPHGREVYDIDQLPT